MIGGQRELSTKHSGESQTHRPAITHNVSLGTKILLILILLEYQVKNVALCVIYFELVSVCLSWKFS